MHRYKEMSGGKKQNDPEYAVRFFFIVIMVHKENFSMHLCYLKQRSCKLKK